MLGRLKEVGRVCQTRRSPKIQNFVDGFQDRLDDAGGFDFGNAEAVSDGANEMVFGESHGCVLMGEEMIAFTLSEMKNPEPLASVICRNSKA
jgi:hypothetical protein